MKIKEIQVENYEKVLIADLGLGMSSIISIHNTHLGPSLGGLRFFPYKNEEEALFDVKRLSEAMTYKAALADLALGGGKAVIIGDPHHPDKNKILENFAAFVNTLKGKYITAKDVGTSVEDLAHIAQYCPFVAGYNHEKSSGDPSPMTAWGVYCGMKSLAGKIWPDALKSRKILIQGLGQVAFHLLEFLKNEACELIVSDIDSQKKSIANAFGAKWVDASQVFDQECDVFAPCALGGMINDHTLPQLIKSSCQLIAGGANNQLLDPILHGRALLANEIVYAPDYVINAGGLINIAVELSGYDFEKAKSKTSKIGATLDHIYELSRSQNRSMPEIALELALAKILS